MSNQLNESVTTRSVMPDSIQVALENSALLHELNLYNDSVMSNTIEPYSFLSWIKKNFKIIKADADGMVVGLTIGSKIGNAAVAICFGCVFSTLYSLEAAASQDKDSNTMPKKLPPSKSQEVESIDKYYTQALGDDFDNYCTLQYELAEIDASTAQYGAFFKNAVMHNLTLDKYFASDDYEDISWLENSSICKSIINSDQIMGFFCDDIQNILDDNINYNVIFSDRINLTQTISQAKAAQVFEKYMTVVKSHSYLSQIRYTTRAYMSSVLHSDELSDTEKDILLNSLPVTLFSAAYWENKFGNQE